MDNFLQSKEWEEFQNALGRKTFRVNNILLIKHNLPFSKSYLYIPRTDLNEKMLKEVHQIAQKEKAIFLRYEPLTKRPEKNFLKTKSHQPEKTLILDLQKSEKEMLSQMHQKARYNIRLAQRHKLKVEKSNNLKDLEIFWQLAKKTEKRGRFRYFPKIYYQKLIETLGKKDLVKIFTAYLNKKPIASNIVLFYRKTAFYLFGASDYQFRQYMAPHLLQWEAIKEGKKRGLKFYDLWGIDEKRWPGITRFKRGFGGQEISYPGTFELPYHKFWYRLYKLAKWKI